MSSRNKVAGVQCIENKDQGEMRGRCSTVGLDEESHWEQIQEGGLLERS